ncbi:MAG: hypothetical protein IPL65_02010 [Lewinellaceae bacterium]|nr:hypothetical protein [Lewinellaceae bacterium]
MKTLFTAVTLLTALGLMSFMTAPDSGIRRDAKYQYTSTADARLSAADSEVVLSTIAEKYRLGDYTMIEGDLLLEPLKARKGNWIIKKKLFLTWLDEQFITWETEGEVSDLATVQRLDEIVSKYAATK